MHIPEEIVAGAKSVMLEFGEHLPTIFVFGTKDKAFLHPDMGKDVIGRSAGMMSAGGELARGLDVGEITQVILVIEGWMSPPRATFLRPSQDPNRLEVLLISAIDAQTEEQILEAYACIRDKNQAVVELKKVSTPDASTVKSPLLPAFLAGYRWAKQAKAK